MRVADCVPILLASSTTGVVAAVHAGWRGVVAHVIDAAFDAERDRLDAFDLAAIGPCIGACCFEIGDDVDRRSSRPTSAIVTATCARPSAPSSAREASQDSHIDDVPGCTSATRRASSRTVATAKPPGVTSP